MCSPTPMARLFLVTLDHDLPRATEVLGRVGAVHLLSVDELGPWAHGLAWEQAAGLAVQYDGYRQRIEGLLRGLAIGPPPGAAVAAVAPLTVAARVERRLPPIEAEAQRVAAAERQLQEEGKRLALAAEQLQLLAQLRVDLAELRRLEFLHCAAALVPQRNLERLRGSLAGLPNALIPLARREKHVLVLAFTTREQGAALERALQSAYAQPARIPLDLAGTPAEVLRQVQAQQAQVLQQEAALQRTRGALAAQHRDELWQLAQEVATNAAAVAAWQRFGRTERTRLIAGWAPAAVVPGLAARLEQAVAGRPALDVAAAPAPQVAQAPRPPTRLRNPPPARPFEALVTTYGIPSYDEIDPTPLAGFLFVLMFGVMFGDVGQGAVIAAAGWLLTREIALKGSRAFGWVLLAAGISAIVFGALYGTVFLTEGLIPALWFRPLDNPTYFIQVAVIFGVAVVSLALALNMANALRNGDRLGFLLSRQGLVGLWFYWGAVYAAYAALAGRGLGTLALLALIGLPLLVMACITPLQDLFRGGARPGPQAFVQSVVETFDTAVRYVSNTVSFIRLAAFAIAHAGIGIMVLILAGLVRVPGGGAAVLVLGNAFVIGLEGLVIFIQALRLDYYEFFTRFFRASGIPFRPFVLPGARRGFERPAPLPGPPQGAGQRRRPLKTPCPGLRAGRARSETPGCRPGPQAQAALPGPGFPEPWVLAMAAQYEPDRPRRHPQ